MTLRRYSPMKASSGTTIPGDVRAAVLARDGMCVGPQVGMPGICVGGLELDHVRASHGMGMKSETTVGNLVALCSGHHRLRTSYGKTWRPILLDYIARTDCGHVDPVFGCCDQRVTA